MMSVATMHNSLLAFAQCNFSDQLLFFKFDSPFSLFFCAVLLIATTSTPAYFGDFSLVRYRVEHEKIKFVSTSGHVMFCLLYKHTNDDFFYDFPKIFENYPKISEDSPKVVRRPDKRFRTFSLHTNRIYR